MSGKRRKWICRTAAAALGRPLRRARWNGYGTQVVAQNEVRRAKKSWQRWRQYAVATL